MDDQNVIPIQADAMRLGRLEFLAMNNPLRRWIQKHVEFRTFKNQLKRYRINLGNKAILDAGCGSGYSTELIVNEFHPSHIVAFDYMPEQISLARKRNLKVDFSVGDLTAINAANDTFDAVFIFGVLHHIPEWRTAIAEVSRVLNPEGVLLVEEPQERFTWEQFESGVNRASLDILAVEKVFFNYFRAYLPTIRDYANGGLFITRMMGIYASLPDIHGQVSDFLSRIARINEFHECFLIIRSKIRVICPFVSFVIQRCRVMKQSTTTTKGGGLK